MQHLGNGIYSKEVSPSEVQLTLAEFMRYANKGKIRTVCFIPKEIQLGDSSQIKIVSGSLIVVAES